MLSFTAKEKPVIYVFSSSLQLEAKTEVPLKVPERADIKVLPFPDFYFLYVHRDGSATHELWKIDRMGNAVSLTAAMEAVIQEQFKKHTATFQLINKDKQFAIVGATYYNELEKISYCYNA